MMFRKQLLWQKKKRNLTDILSLEWFHKRKISALTTPPSSPGRVQGGILPCFRWHVSYIQNSAHPSSECFKGIRVYADAAQAPLPTQHFQLPRHMTLSLRFHNTHSEAQPEAEQEQEQVRVSVKSELPQHALAQSCTFLNELEVCSVDGERWDPVLYCVKGFCFSCQWQNVNDIIKVLQEHPTWLAFFFRRLSLKSQVLYTQTHTHHRSLSKGPLISFCRWSA